LDRLTDELTELQPENKAEKRLARGLEDVSYLFLSQTAGERQDSAQGQNPAPALQPAHPANTIVLRASPPISRELLLSLLSKNAAVLENGMRVIDANVPCDPFGPVDLLALDGVDQPVIIDVDTAQIDTSLLRGIGQFDWFVRNTPILRRMYQGMAVNFSAQPRLFLVAPGFSPLLRCAAQRNANPKVSCFGYHSVAISGGVGVLFEAVCI